MSIGLLLEGFAPAPAAPMEDFPTSDFTTGDKVAVSAKGNPSIVGRVVRPHKGTHAIVAPEGGGPHVKAPIGDVKLHTPAQHAMRARRQAAAALKQAQMMPGPGANPMAKPGAPAAAVKPPAPVAEGVSILLERFDASEARDPATGKWWKAGAKVIYKNPMGIDHHSGELASGDLWRGHLTVRDPQTRTTVKVPHKDVVQDSGEWRHYFTGEGDMLAPVGDLAPSEVKSDLERSVGVARQRMADAKAGKAAKRKPLTVRFENRRMIVVDGKSTLETAKRMGLSHVPVQREQPPASQRFAPLSNPSKVRPETPGERRRRGLQEAFTPPPPPAASGETPAQSNAIASKQVAAAQKSLSSGWNASKHPRSQGGKFGYTTGGKRATRSSASPARTLGNGSSGALVKSIQHQLNIPADGKYGPQTTAAIARYQRQHGLQVDGVVGRQTLTQLRGGNGRTVHPGAITSKQARLTTHPVARRTAKARAAAGVPLRQTSTAGSGGVVVGL